ncbi:MAG: DNA photolyase family protein [Candidatus Eremiobacteraeota bacterium]|nr:DNA photolyase family protein [Candidatus Eremiobacteraeota bacterium]
MTPERVIYRFRYDLRLADHAGLAQAAASGDIVPVVVLDHLLEQRLARSSRRAAFFSACVASLDASLREHGSRLIVRRGSAGTVLKNIARASGAKSVFWAASYDASTMQSDERLQSDLEEAGLRATVVHDAPAIAPEETASAREDGSGYRAFAPYFETWRTLAVSSYEAPLLLRFSHTDLQSEPLPDAAGSRESDAGERGALTTLKHFLEGAAVTYATGMNAPADHGTSRMSAHLSFGSISARSIVRAVVERSEDPFLLAEERSSLRLYVRSIAMRDFFLQLGWYAPHTHDRPLQEKMRYFSTSRTHPALEQWREGKTGYPLVDAGIRQLHQTGWMHPHVRAVAASFLCFDLGVDWRVGRDEWERWLIEDAPALATGNWQWIAGVGADMAQFPRIYNPHKQRRRFDPDGTYVRRYVTELAHVPTGAWQTSRSSSPQLVLPLFADDGYPQPVVNHEQAAGDYLQRYRTHVGVNG